MGQGIFGLDFKICRSLLRGWEIREEQMEQPMVRQGTRKWREIQFVSENWSQGFRWDCEGPHVPWLLALSCTWNIWNVSWAWGLGYLYLYPCTYLARPFPILYFFTLLLFFKVWMLLFLKSLSSHLVLDELLPFSNSCILHLGINEYLLFMVFSWAYAIAIRHW